MLGPLTPNSELLVVGDLNGSKPAFNYNCFRLGLLKSADEDSIPSLPPNSIAVFLGDILADRKRDGLEIIRAILAMREEFRRVATLWGNHETFAAGLLLPGVNIPSLKYPGLLDILKLHPDADTIFDKRVLNATTNNRGLLNLHDDLWNEAIATFREPAVRAEALATEDGKMLSRYLIGSQLYHRHGDTVCFHTPPTAQMLSFMLTTDENLNLEFSQWTKILLEGTADKEELLNAASGWSHYADIFLNTRTRLKNRPPFPSFPNEEHPVWHACKKEGINRIVFGHDGQDQPLQLKCGPVYLYGADMRCMGPNGRPSTAVVRREGVWIAGKRMKERREMNEMIA